MLRGARLLIYRKKGDESNVREVVIVPGCFVSEVTPTSSNQYTRTPLAQLALRR